MRQRRVEPSGHELGHAERQHHAAAAVRIVVGEALRLLERRARLVGVADPEIQIADALERRLYGAAESWIRLEIDARVGKDLTVHVEGGGHVALRREHTRETAPGKRRAGPIKGLERERQAAAERRRRRVVLGLQVLHVADAHHRPPDGRPSSRFS